MSLSENFHDWCRSHGYRPRPAVYLRGELGGLEENDARIVRMVPPELRSGSHRMPQTYVVELRENNELFYPLGAKPKSKAQLLAAMLTDVGRAKGSRR